MEEAEAEAVEAEEDKFLNDVFQVMGGRKCLEK